MISQFFIANSTYSLLQYSLAFTKKIDNTFFLLGPAIKDCTLKSKASIKLPPKEMLSEYIHSFLDKLESKLEGFEVPFYGNLVTPYAREISERYPFYSLSDGASDSHMVEKHLNNKNIIQCYTTKLGHDIEKSAHPKLIVHDLEKLWNEKTEKEKAKIASIFNVNEKTLKLLESKSVILITQPLSEDSIVSEEEKIQLYKSILSNYDLDQVVIKPHPREKTNWGEIFPNVPIITRQVPAELLSMMVKPKKVCTFYSTAAFSLCPPENVDIYSKDFSNLIFAHPGQNMGNVPYIDIEKVYGHRPFNWKKIPHKAFYHSNERS
ncbi:MAG: hypothetical protein J6V53_04710 [Alphaproteobacteria bacterium]|nr:hypothetical protein [Alphaproteobacteria bacterium]